MSKPSIRKQIANALERPILWASGADLDILASVPTEKSKYFGIGGTILFTAMMASLAGGYAFFTAFKDPTLSIFFGVFWGGLIFNLDRYIVSTFGVGDGKRTISRQELIEGAPRIVMAIVLGIVIATPLELKLFEAEINSEIELIKIERRADVIRQLRESSSERIDELNNQITDLESDIQKRNDELKRMEEIYAAANDRALGERLGRETGKPGEGDHYRDLRATADRLLNDLNQMKDNYGLLTEADEQRITELKELINSENDRLGTAIKDEEDGIDSYDGILARLEALGKLTSKNRNLWYASNLIRLLLVLIEIAPILFKMMTERGPYDDIIDRIKHEVKVRQLLEQSNINQEINHQVKIRTDRIEQRMIAESLANKELLTSIAQAQREIASAAIETWKREQLEKAKSNSDSFVNPRR